MSAREEEAGPAPHGQTFGGYLAQMAQAARDRAGSWDAAADVLALDEATVARLRDGSLAAAWRAASGWLGDDAELFLADLMSLDVYERGAARRTPEEDLASLRPDHRGIVGDQAAALAGAAREVARLCRAEADAWAGGDLAGGKALRGEERQVIDARLVPVLPALGGRLVREAGVSLWRTLGRLLLAVLSVETGTDYQRSVLGSDLGRHRA
ncbi:hypothetical protein [Georgenia sp. AZ-5]|uniref:hypothetical protein n=1 Tax=Georgenia sp. AZ-5 TaxID=3367526 RepID=UPI003754E108